MPRRLVLGLLLVGLTACGSSGHAASPSATVAPTARRTTTTSARTPEQEVEAAYLKSWDVYAYGMRHLDDSRYPEVYAGDALTLRSQELADLKKAGTPAQMTVEHDYSVSVFDDGKRAVVVDAYRNHSVLVDATSGAPTEPDPNNLLKRQYEFRKEGGMWVIVRVSSLS
jgi:hypothetical protein